MLEYKDLLTGMNLSLFLLLSTFCVVAIALCVGLMFVHALRVECRCNFGYEVFCLIPRADSSRFVGSDQRAWMVVGPGLPGNVIDCRTPVFVGIWWSFFSFRKMDSSVD